jgi:DNA (cytosine-5)-methyltransferase 1
VDYLTDTFVGFDSFITLLIFIGTSCKKKQKKNTDTHMLAGETMINGELVVDNFAGGGGASTGIEMATGVSVDIAINHDPEAIRMHRTNHPTTKHYCEDVWQVDPVKACGGHPVGLAWFSPDCKHFSKAKGGKPKDKFIRGLAWVACRWAGLVRPRVIMLENVEEFKTWGPLNRRHHPIKSRSGETFKRFIKQLTDLGYTVEFRELVAADYGAPTMRKRFFLIARCDNKPILWPEPTHAPLDSEAVKKGILKPYVGAYTQLDFSIPCPSIFDTSEEIKKKYGVRAVRPLAPKTMQRIARGIQKFVVDNADPFIVEIGYGESKNQKSPRAYSVEKPLHTIVAKDKNFLVAPILTQYHSYENDSIRGQGISEPIMTVDSSNRYGLVTSFLSKFYKIGIGQDEREPLHTVTTSAGHFGEVRAFLIKYYGSNDGQNIKQPLDTITTHDRFGLVTIKGVDYQIVDIGLRMLEPRELYGCQGFPDDYIIDQDYSGKSYPRSEQVKRCGNAVCPPIPAALVRANLPEMCLRQRMPNMKVREEETGQLKFA